VELAAYSTACFASSVNSGRCLSSNDGSVICFSGVLVNGNSSSSCKGSVVDELVKSSFVDSSSFSSELVAVSSLCSATFLFGAGLMKSFVLPFFSVVWRNQFHLEYIFGC